MPGARTGLDLATLSGRRPRRSSPIALITLSHTARPCISPAFASPEVYEFLEAENFKYAIRLPANKVLQDSIAHLLKRPVGRPPGKPQVLHAGFGYHVQSGLNPRVRTPRSASPRIA